MSKLRIALVLLLVATACLAVGARLYAETPPVYTIDQDWAWATDGAYVWEQDFNVVGDPSVVQTIRNCTQTQWTDWHVDIVNGTLTDISNIVVKNLQATQLNWAVEPYADGKGFFAHVYSGHDTQVDYYEQLYVSFNYTVDDDTQQVSVKQYPTTTYAIPEPASIAGILMGLMGMGFGIRRKK